MNIHFRRLPSGMVLVAVLILVSGCSGGNDIDNSVEALYKQASAFTRSRQYLKAIDYYNKALALDTLQMASPRVVQALNEKRVLESMTGEYYDALATTERLEKLSKRALPDSVRNKLFSDKATLLSELGNFRTAAESLEKIVSPSQDVQFEQASLYLESGDGTKAMKIYRKFTSAERDPVTRIAAFAGLLQCKVAKPELALESPDALAARIAAESKRVFAMEEEFIPRIQAIRMAAKSLLLLEKQHRNASYLLFRALMLAEQSQNQFFIQLLRQESNAVIVRKADTFREAADYFRINNMQYAQAISLFLLADSKNLDYGERVAALQQGLTLSRDFLPPYPAAAYQQLEKRAGGRLTGLLLEKSRIFELFDAEEKIGTLELKRTLQRYPNSFTLGKAHEVLEAQVRRLQHETAGLLQRKANMVIRGEGIEKSRQVDQALNIKRGKMLELLSEVRAINPLAADAIQFVPVTLQTVQSALKEGQLIVKPLLSDSLAGVMLIGKRQLQIAGSPLPFDAVHTPELSLRAVRSELASAPAPLLSESEQTWLSQALYEPAAASITGFRRVVVIADDLFPFHILERAQRPVSGQQYSYVQSLKEFVLLSEHTGTSPGASQIFFYRADHVAGARMHKLFAPRDRIFLLWKPFGTDELQVFRQQISRQMQVTVSASEALLLLERSAGSDVNRWNSVSSLGVD